MGKIITKDGKRSHPKKGTTLWYVWFSWNDETVYVSSSPANEPKYVTDRMRIRTITPRAAARKYIRDNLLHRLAVFSVEDRYGYGVTNRHTVDFVERDDLKAAKLFAPKNLSIKVLK